LLQRTTQIHQQPLIYPLSVETSAALELVIAEHLETFTQNGFKLSVDLQAPTGSRVKLHSMPFSKSVRFGVDDVNELASMISEHHRGGADDGAGGDATSQRTSKSYLMLKNDSLATTPLSDTTNPLSGKDGGQQQPHEIDFRLPKLVAMYASRACRSAIMIGTALHDHEMHRVVSRLEHVDQPWNCPHGRPTLRHLVDLTPLWAHSSHRDSLPQP
jgi:DNA mismatch repair protein PMS2